ncbi:hypothetical protein LEMLEM_LOCUS12007 [Lemmus lemmus]
MHNFCSAHLKVVWAEVRSTLLTNPNRLTGLSLSLSLFIYPLSIQCALSFLPYVCRVMEPLKLKLQTVLSYHVDAGN